MTRKALVERELKRMKTVERFAEKRRALKNTLSDSNTTPEEKREARVKCPTTTCPESPFQMPNENRLPMKSNRLGVELRKDRGADFPTSSIRGWVAIL